MFLWLEKKTHLSSGEFLLNLFCSYLGIDCSAVFVGPDQGSLITEVIKNNRWQQDVIIAIEMS